MAYLVTEDREKADGRELRRYLRSKLPEHMVPARFVQVAELPLLPSGKVNRRALATAEGVVLSEQGTVRRGRRWNRSWRGCGEKC